MTSPDTIYSLARRTRSWKHGRGHLSLKGRGKGFSDGVVLFQRRSNSVNQEIDLPDLLLIKRFKIRSSFRIGAGHDLDRLPEMIKNHQGIGDQEDGLVFPGSSVFPGRQLFKKSGQLIPAETHGPAIKTGQTRNGNRSVTA